MVLNFFTVLVAEIKVQEVKEDKLCPRFPEPVPLKHPIPALMDALEKVGPAIKKEVIMYDLDQ